MYFTREADGFKAWVLVQFANGDIATGLDPSVFTITIVDPTDSATHSPVVSESTSKPGLYTFLITDTFLAANGVGNYGVVVEINAPGPNPIKAARSDVLSVFNETFDNLAESVLLSLVDGTIDVRTALKRLNSMARGRITLPGQPSKPAQDAVYYDESGDPLYTNRNTGDERNPV